MLKHLLVLFLKPVSSTICRPSTTTTTTSYSSHECVAPLPRSARDPRPLSTSPAPFSASAHQKNAYHSRSPYTAATGFACCHLGSVGSHQAPSLSKPGTCWRWRWSPLVPVFSTSWWSTGSTGDSDLRLVPRSCGAGASTIEPRWCQSTCPLFHHHHRRQLCRLAGWRRPWSRFPCRSCAWTL